MHKIANLWKFELIWSSKLRDNNGRNKTPLSHESVWFQMLNFETSKSKWGFNIHFKYFFGKLLLIRKLFYFRGSCFSQCCILSRALHCLLPSKLLWYQGKFKLGWYTLFRLIMLCLIQLIALLVLSLILFGYFVTQNMMSTG